MAPHAMPQPMQPPPAASIPGEDPAIIAQLDGEIVAHAAMWTEHRAPDGRSYFYNSKAGESVWERPQALKDLEGGLFSNTKICIQISVERISFFRELRNWME